MTSPFISLYMTLFKSLRLELQEGGKYGRYDEAPFSPFTVDSLLEMVGRFARFTRKLWEGKGLSAVTSMRASALGGSGSKGAGSSSSSSRRVVKPVDLLADAASKFRAWLRLQLLLLRSWVLLCEDISGKDTASGAKFAASKNRARLVLNFRQECGIGRDSVLMNAVIEACGCDTLGERRGSKAFATGHARWECFAFQHLEGRTLPGCSNWGCTNLAGISEAAMPTLLCNGCRRARYCSVACQRAAWVEGGHGEVCGGSTAAIKA